MYRILIVAGVFAMLAFVLFEDSVSHEPGVLVPEPPLQTDAPEGLMFMHKDYLVKPLAAFEGQARVLSHRRYRLDRESDLSPVDLALGWGAMSDERVLEYLNISQSNRWYWWSYKQLPIPRNEIIHSSANMHIIPADELVERELMRIKEGHIITFKGYLVEVQGDDGWRWRSSLTREDTGNHACELVWVDALEIQDFN